MVVSVGRLISGLSDSDSRLGVLLGLASVPFTVALSIAGNPDAISGLPLVTVGILIGVLYSGRGGRSRKVGYHGGLAASLGVIISQTLYMIPLISEYSFIWSVVLLLVMPVVWAVGIALSALLVAGMAVVSARLVRYIF